jgi:hypothetical protein
VCRLQYQERSWANPTKLFWMLACIVATHYAKKWDKHWAKFLKASKEEKDGKSMATEAMSDLSARMESAGMDMDRLMAPPQWVMGAVAGVSKRPVTELPGYPELMQKVQDGKMTVEEALAQGSAELKRILKQDASEEKSSGDAPRPGARSLD